ncbi:polyprenyl synthase [Streptomyces sp. NBC_01497]|uniref:polyprenyl synthase n=1 Tax=Streptomyces sp. NBC_01497 TaxID=2903885 RepID=UPI002E372A4A|nr:polyprenyl synthase [Streptomyces sp. NBC_01497]
MSDKDVTEHYRTLLERRRMVTAALSSELALLARDRPSLSAAILQLLDSDGSTESPFRLLPFPVLGAITADPQSALPVAMLSRLWWTGAESFDDLTDGDFDPEQVGLSSAQASISSAACLTLVPQLLIEHLDVPAKLRAAWAREFVTSSLRSAEGQLDDVSASPNAITWSTTMRIYAGKSGAPYGRDAAMTAMLARVGNQAIEGWRVFGKLFGILRQMANDRASHGLGEDRDLENGTWTLLMALAVEMANPTEADALAALRDRARLDTVARREIREHLSRTSAAIAYNDRIYVIRRKLSGLLGALAKPSEHRDLIQWMIDASAEDARLTAERGAV